jgi:hypothetical protein
MKNSLINWIKLTIAILSVVAIVFMVAYALCGPSAGV